MSYLLAKRTIQISSPTTAVFSYAANLENFSAWFPGVLSIRAQDSLAIDEVGKTYEEIVSVPFGRSTKVRIQVVEASQPVRIVTEGDYRVLLPRMEMDFRPNGENETQVEWRMYSRRRGILAGLLLPVLSFVLKSRSRHALTKLKGTLESGEKSVS
ncbi:MAG TPA: SRPBCC family protein [Acidobacteriaceae bacterium]|nr:SRPBCC family protein [Acidobacteriaceae bacterium]